ncbi:ABC transporter ATP-binding protein [Camelimonas lactis]|uniref:Branched-chain amino acid transport system ATP-binding protein n=1 Tax=Camelimonas lactis TaxID=659006 RepID=A0A4V2RX67_9HYPH|nr:ABC transporter ATP-binding protein [Camelimonas lactis]TCO12061.1 branched-chain amino acid transport system ATP-binding protein [Camelimonas lactis]
MSALLQLEKLSVAYHGVDAVRGVSLSAPRGAIVSVIGANGAGKSTMLNAAMGILPARGQIMFDGAPIHGLSVEERFARGIALVAEKRELFATLPVEDNLALGRFRFRREGRAAAHAALEEVYDLFPRLRERRRQLAGTLSGGERQMLAMGRALMGKPRLLMLDEPSLGLAPLIVREIFRIVVSLRERGVSILLVEQNARAALQISDYGYVLENGRVSLEGPSAALQEDARVAATYLGFGAQEDGDEDENGEGDDDDGEA